MRLFFKIWIAIIWVSLVIPVVLDKSLTTKQQFVLLTTGWMFLVCAAIV